MNLHEQAVALRDYLADPDHWTTGNVAKNEEGYEVGPLFSGAVCHCLVGAALKVCNVDTSVVEAYGAVDELPLGKALAEVIRDDPMTPAYGPEIDPGEVIWDFNDCVAGPTGHHRVVALLDKLVETTKEQGQ